MPAKNHKGIQFNFMDDVKAKVRALGLSYERLSEQINALNIGDPISANTISKIMNGYRKMSAELLYGLDLLLKNETPQMGDPKAVVNLLIEESVNCGSNGFIYDVKEEIVTIPSHEYKKGLKAYLASGYNMGLEISDCDYIIADPSLPPRNGDLVVYDYNGLKACKVYIKQGSEYILKPLIISNDCNILRLNTNVKISFETVVKIIKNPLHANRERLRAVYE